MNIKTVWAVYFSGTGTTEKVATTLAKDLAERLGAGYDTYCFNLPQAREKDLSFGPEDLVVLGTPVYAGRGPNLLMPYVRDHIKGNGTLLLIEKWTDAQAQKAHLETPHMKQMAAFKPEYVADTKLISCTIPD